MITLLCQLTSVDDGHVWYVSQVYGLSKARSWKTNAKKVKRAQDTFKFCRACLMGMPALGSFLFKRFHGRVCRNPDASSKQIKGIARTRRTKTFVSRR
jgi:hypothetical protein